MTDKKLDRAVTVFWAVIVSLLAMSVLSDAGKQPCPDPEFQPSVWEPMGSSLYHKEGRVYRFMNDCTELDDDRVAEVGKYGCLQPIPVVGEMWLWEVFGPLDDRMLDSDSE